MSKLPVESMKQCPKGTIHNFRWSWQAYTLNPILVPPQMGLCHMSVVGMALWKWSALPFLDIRLLIVPIRIFICNNHLTVYNFHQHMHTITKFKDRRLFVIGHIVTLYVGPQKVFISREFSETTMPFGDETQSGCQFCSGHSPSFFAWPNRQGECCTYHYHYILLLS